ncbi:hypothetical protein SLA2020_067970 [Shorea laevis]
MASLQSFLYVAIVAVLALSSSRATALKRSTPLQAAPSPLIESVCKSNAVGDYNSCIKALSCPQAAAATNPNALTKVVLKLARDDAKATVGQILNLIKTGPSPALDQCLKNYQSAVNAFKMVASELKEDPMSANYDIKVNTDLADECDRSLAAARLTVPQLTAANQSLRRFAMIGFQVTNLLQ